MKAHVLSCSNCQIDFKVFEGKMCVIHLSIPMPNTLLGTR